MRPSIRIPLFLVMLLALAGARAQGGDPLPSWNAGAARQAIVDFVGRVTREGGADFVPPGERIAAFDNDGTLWVEQPMYTQLAFAIDRIRALAPRHPQWKDTQPFKAALEGDMQTLMAGGEAALLELVTASHAGMSTAAFEGIVRDWLAGARHPRFRRPYTQLVYRPMLELMAYLRANGFKVYIVSGGGIGFMRPWSEAVYGVPPGQVIGSSIETRYEVGAHGPELVRMNRIHFVNDKGGKPVAINRFIGRRPILAFGNSDGDYPMLQWTTAGPGARLGAIVHHTDCRREYCYDRKSPLGRLDRALDDAGRQGWLVIDMRRDWKAIFPAKNDANRGVR